MAAWRYGISLLVLKNCSLRSLLKYFSEAFVSPRGHLASPYSTIFFYSQVINKKVPV